jgi:hypothetical protein
MISLLLALMAASSTPTALDAERAFDAAAARDGQWTAFRAFAAPKAIMFVPQPVDAQDWLKDRKNPSQSVRWQATASYVSCDGNSAVNTGNWQRPDGSLGYFTTVWQRQPDGSWKWLVDGGDVLKTARPALREPVVRRAACHGTAFVPPVGVAPPPGVVADPEGWGLSRDGSLLWCWRANPDGRNRMLTVDMVTGPKSTMQVIGDGVP